MLKMSRINVEEINNYYLQFNSLLNAREKVNVSKKNSMYNIEKFMVEEQILDVGIDYKPKNGYWLSHGMKQHSHNNNRGWLDWCLSEMPQWILPSENDVYAVELNDELIYKIDTREKMEEFTLKYGVEQYGVLEKIDWRKVKDDGYYGVEVLNFRRIILSTIWYNHFDCSSLVVWDYRAINSVRKL
jgi:hypothetical protein